MSEPLWKIEATRQYLESLSEKVSALRMLLGALVGDPSEAHRAALFRAFHRISGSAGSYGCDRLGDIAFACASLLSSPAPVTPATVDALCRAVDEFAEVAAGLASALDVPAPAGRGRPRVLVVDDEPEAQSTLRTLLEREGFAVQIASTRAEAEALLDRSPPAAVIIDLRLTDGSGLELLTRLREPGLPHRIPALVISAIGDFGMKLETVRRGSDAYFEKPLEWEAVVRKLRSLLDPQHDMQSRILLVEDDPEQAAFVVSVLEGAGYVVRVCGDAMCVEERLASFPPDLILLDVNLPSGSGVDIAGYLRQRESYAAVPIIFLTAADDPLTEIEAIEAGGDDYLRKPVSRQLLLTSVGARLKRASQLKSMLDHDSLTGTLTHAAIVERIALAASVKRRNSDAELSLIMLDVDRFKDVNDHYGHLTGDRVLASLGSFLRHHLRDVDVVGRYGGEEFAIILAAGGAAAAAVARKLLDAFSATAHASDDGRSFRVSFTAGVAELENGMSAEAWKLAADRALLAGKEAGRRQVVVAEPTELPPLDEDALAPLRELGARAGISLIAELRDLFFQTLPDRMRALELSVAAGDAAGLERAAHALRSVAGNLGARKLAWLCAELEGVAAGGTAEECPPIVNEIVLELSRVTAALRRL